MSNGSRLTRRVGALLAGRRCRRAGRKRPRPNDAHHAEAEKVGVDAYGYALLTSDVTRETGTNVDCTRIRARSRR